jgi:hypothetical protein
LPAAHRADSHDLIRVQGARENNLKDLSVALPKRRLTVFTGFGGRWRKVRRERVNDTHRTAYDRRANEAGRHESMAVTTLLCGCPNGTFVTRGEIRRPRVM